MFVIGKITTEVLPASLSLNFHAQNFGSCGSAAPGDGLGVLPRGSSVQPRTVWLDSFLFCTCREHYQKKMKKKVKQGLANECQNNRYLVSSS